MKRLSSYALTLLLIMVVSVAQAQTQEEIRQMMGGEQTEETTDSESKKAKKERKRAEKDAKEKADESEKAAEDAQESVEETVEETIETVESEVDNTKKKAKKEKKKKKDEAEEMVEEVETAADSMAAEAMDSTKAKTRDRSSSLSSSRSGRFTQPYRTWSIHVGGHVTHPYTDIRYRDFFGTLDPKNENQWGVQAGVTKMFDAAFGLRLNAGYHVLQGVFDNNVGSEEDRRYLETQGFGDGVYFRNNVITGSANLYWNISNTIFGMNRYYKAKQKARPIKQRRFSLYTAIGLGLTGFDAHLMELADDAPYVNENNLAFQALDNQAIEVFFPLTLGSKFNLGKAVDLGIEYRLNFVLTDKLDGVVYNHPNRMKNDMFSNLGITLNFKTGTKKKSDQHIEWINPVQPILEDIANVKRDVNSLTRDSDGDGVADRFDKEDDTPEGVRVDGAGQTVDSDGDGIPDGADLEPFSDKDVTVDEFGRAVDSDGDGVPDHLDQEENTPSDKLVNFEGRTIENYLDIPEDNSRMGGLYIPSVYFDTDKATIKREYEDELFQIARIMNRAPELSFVLTGHCDERGSAEYNEKLGMRRAEQVRNYLVENYGIDESRLRVESMGSEMKDSPRYSVNRRVDIQVAQ